MRKIDLEDLELFIKKKLSSGNYSSIYRLSNGDIFKMFDEEYLMINKLGGISLEDKIVNADKVFTTDDILKPKVCVYSGDNFVGYTTDYVDGKSYSYVDRNLPLDKRKDLFYYADLYKKIEDIVRKNEKIVFPDLCTCDNIIMGDNGKITLIDYDGLQVDNYNTGMISTALGDL